MAEHTREELEDLNKDGVYELATEAEIEGRSGMNKAELIDALLAVDAGTEVEERTKPSTSTVERVTGEDDDGNPVVEEVEVERAAVDRISPEGGTVHPGTIDTAGVERREAARKAQADRPGRVRPTPASIDPRLVEQRKAQAKADAERNAPRPATAPPNRG